MLNINPKKTKIMIFQKNTKKCDYTFHIGDELIDIVQDYTYLGTRISSSGNFTLSLEHLRQKALHAFFSLKARLHVKREGTARLETSTGSRRNLPFTRTNSVMYLTEKGTVFESPLERVLAVYTLFSSRPVTIEPAIIKTKLLRLVVHMRLHIQYTVRISDYHMI